MNLTKLHDALYTSELRTDLTARSSAALLTQAGIIVRSPTASPSRKEWALRVLSDPKSHVEPIIGFLLTNGTVQGHLDSNTEIPDGDIEYIVTAEVLPVIAPE
jgi:hypothetical protein